jgi:hypothetical protein
VLGWLFLTVLFYHDLPFIKHDENVAPSYNTVTKNYNYNELEKIWGKFVFKLAFQINVSGPDKFTFSVFGILFNMFDNFKGYTCDGLTT